MPILAANAGHWWYDSPLVVAVFTVVLTLLATHANGIIERRIQARRHAKYLRSGFAAEVSVIQFNIAQAAEFSLKHHDRATALPAELPTKFYGANVGRLADLN